MNVKKPTGRENSTRISMSLAGVCSPRETEPKIYGVRFVKRALSERVYHEKHVMGYA